MDHQEMTLNEISASLKNGNTITSSDLLTDADVEELRLLLSLPSSEIQARSKAGMKDPVMAGRYRLLCNAGFLDGAAVCSGDTIVFGCNPTAAWAVAKHDRLKEIEADAAKERKRQRRIDRFFSILIGFGGVILGWVLASIHF